MNFKSSYLLNGTQKLKNIPVYRQETKNSIYYLFLDLSLNINKVGPCFIFIFYLQYPSGI